MEVDGKKALTILDKAEKSKSNGEFETALSFYNEYLALVHPSFTHGVWFSMAEIYFQKKQFQDALAHCDKALSIMKDFIPALELRIKVYKELGNTFSAQKDKALIDQWNKIEQSKWDDPNHHYHYK
ncbi:tetratricopeptide repeat protein [Leptospira bouyouniensis]|nr:tetratricopeptide repeat protein [Leptospira bouyouniensis]